MSSDLHGTALVVLERLDLEIKTLTTRLHTLQQSRETFAKHGEHLAPVMELFRKYGRGTANGGPQIPPGATAAQAVEVLLQHRGRPVKVSALKAALSLNKVSIAGLSSVLAELAAQGRILSPRAGVWLAANAADATRKLKRARRSDKKSGEHATDFILRCLPASKAEARTTKDVTAAIQQDGWATTGANARNIVYQYLLKLLKAGSVKRTKVDRETAWYRVK